MFFPVAQWDKGRKTCTSLKIDWQLYPPFKNAAVCFQKLWKLRVKPCSYQTIAVTLVLWPFSSLLLLAHCFLISASLPLHHLSLSLPLFFSLFLRLSRCPPICQPVLVHPLLSAFVNVFCPYKERAQADCTNRMSLAGVLQGQEDHGNCNGRVRWEEDGGEWMDSWGRGGEATTLLSMTTPSPPPTPQVRWQK